MGIVQKRKRKLAVGNREKKSQKLFMVFFFFSPLVNLEIVFCKEEILESWIHLKVSRYKLK